MKFMKKVKCRHKLFTGIAIGTVLLNAAAWNSTAFCDAYISSVFPLWVNTYGRLTGCFPFSVGEWMIVAGLLLLVLAAGFGAVTLGIWLWGMGSVMRGKRRCKGGKNALPVKWKRFLKGFYGFFAWILLAVCLIMTLNCFILYHASTFSEKYFGQDTREHTLEELLLIYNDIAQQCNSLSVQMNRDETGRVVYPGSILSEGVPGDMGDKAVELMRQLGKTYPQLDGYYPRPKPLLSSDFMCQQYMQGYYFPFSMEANYNDVMYVLNKPSTMCHELAHLRGYIFEDEANFISYLACIQSEDIYFQYSGCLSVLPYVINDLYKARQTDPDAYQAAISRVEPVLLSEQVYEDDVFVTDEEWERINRKAMIDTDTVDKLSDTLVDASLKINGVADGSVSYSRVVKLLLQFYGTP